MARGKGTANLAASIEPLAGAPLDARDIVPTVADLYIASNWPYKYIGMKTTVTATGETYRLVNLDVTQQSSWVLDGASGQTIQVSALPTAGADELGNVYQYIGATGSGVIHGYFYECVFDGSTYSWEEVKTSSLPTVGVGGGYAPIGTIISYMGTTAPQDYLICDGTTYNIADYKQLSDFFAAQFGSSNFFGGDGVTTFKVPDLRGEFLRGTGTNGHSGQGNGANVGTHQDGTEIGEVFSDLTTNFISSSCYKPKNFDKRIKQSNDEAGRFLVNKSSSDEWGYYYTSRPTNTSILYCIKAVAAGDVYSETERVVGTWIDGKPLYQKTVDCGALPNNTTKQVNHNISNIELVISVFAISYDSNKSNMLCIPYLQPKTIANSVGISANNTIIEIISGSDRSSFTTTMATIRYTKTTD